MPACTSKCASSSSKLALDSSASSSRGVAVTSGLLRLSKSCVAATTLCTPLGPNTCKAGAPREPNDRMSPDSVLAQWAQLHLACRREAASQLKRSSMASSHQRLCPGSGSGI
eukprot:10329-Heterococcus_DN1.PRE.1